MKIKRPSLLYAQLAFKDVYEKSGKTVSGVGKTIGGKVNYNINSLTPSQGAFQNSMCYKNELCFE